MCPRYILSDNGIEFKNQLMDQFSSNLGSIQSMENLEVFHKYLKPTLKELCEKDPANWDKYINQVLTSYRVTLTFATAETPFFLVYGKRSQLTLHNFWNQWKSLVGDPESGTLNLENHCLTLAIALKTLDENHFRNAQKTTNRKPPSFQLEDRVYVKNIQPGMGLKMETQIQDCSY